MNNVFFLVMRRMRQPLLSLILVLAVSTLGMMLIPGQDADGNPVQVSFLRAFYFVSYMTTTIGFGELPPGFTDAQRLWVLFCIYANVIVWLYAIGTMFSLFQDQTFQRALHERRFMNQVKRLRRPFYLICGYGDSAEALVADLMERGHQVVVVEPDQERINTLRLGGLPGFVPALCGDSTKPDNLLMAGLRAPLCHGVAALTNKSETNLKVAVTSKLLHPDIKVYCRADRKDVEANMAVFGTNFIIDPYDLFGVQLATAIQAPGLLLLYTWLAEEEEQAKLSDPIYPPQQGHWIVCGYGRFGKVLCRRLLDEGIDVTVVEATPDKTGRPAPETRVQMVEGWGTEADTLRQARLGEAVALVAGTDNDIANLAIIMAARQANPKLFVVARQNQLENSELFEAIKADMIMHPGSIIATQVRTLLATPMLYEFMSQSLSSDHAWACELISRISALVEDEVPRIWELVLDAEGAYAVNWHLQRGGLITLGDLLCNRNAPDQKLAAICLLQITRLGERVLLPEEKTRLQLGDRLLFCTARGVRNQMDWTLQNLHVLSSVLNIQPSLGGNRLKVGRWLRG